MKITSAYASKLIRQLEEEKSFWLQKENTGCTYEAAEGEEPVIPDYDFNQVNANIAEIDYKVWTLRHALNINNALAIIDVDGDVMSVDEILIRTSQLNARKAVLDHLRKLEPKERLRLRATQNARTAVPEYRYINFDPEDVKREYESVTSRIITMQIALDTYNQTATFEVIF